METVLHIFVVVVVFGFVYCELPIKSNEKAEKLEKGRMIGIDTVHDVPINKDTIITRNFIDNPKLDWKTGRKGGMFFWNCCYSSSILSCSNALRHFHHIADIGSVLASYLYL